MEPFMGMIAMFGFSFQPKGWMLCAGQQLPVSQYAALFSLLSTNFGGDGRTTFNLPDLRGRAAIGQGNGPGLTSRLIGQMSGAEVNYLDTLQLPAHSHPASATSVSTSTSTSTSTMYAEGVSSDQQNPRGNMLASGQSIYAAENAQNNRAMSSQAVTTDTTTATTTNTTVQIGQTGGNQPVNNMPPFLVVNYSIAIEGLYPSRN